MKLLKEFLSERLRRLFVANALAHPWGVSTTVRATGLGSHNNPSRSIAQLKGKATESQRRRARLGGGRKVAVVHQRPS